jgi:hypothetical protein
MDWLTLWSIGVYDFGLTDEQFWELTPAQFSALSERYDQDNMRLDFRAAIISSVIANTSRGKDDPPFTPKQFMPDYGDEEVENEEQSAEEMIALLKSCFPQAPPPPSEENG